MSHRATCIAVLGTGSDVGKSIITTALCRILSNCGLQVAPFKAQNMSNNSGVTPEGLEIGRAQVVQAEAARQAPHVDMNPVLLKPTSDIGSQVVLNGKVWKDTSPKSYYQKKEDLFTNCCDALDRLRHAYDVVVMEGAGSCAEVNLMDSDIVNLRMAAYADAPVILVADIDRGGVFAQIIGTLECLPLARQGQIKGFIINRFRGDIDLFTSGVQWIESKTAKPVFGVLPWYNDFAIEAEDSVVIERNLLRPPAPAGAPVIGIVRLPHISNFTDFDPLEALEEVHVRYFQKPPLADNLKALILPGTKSTRSDLEWLIQSGWSDAIRSFAGAGGHILGLCGGYQMLGREVMDPDGVEGPVGNTQGLGLLPVVTELKAPKTTTLTDFCWGEGKGSGYEIHMGRTRILDGEPLVRVTGRNGQPCEDWDGCHTGGGRVMGSYIHGFFDMPDITRLWLDHIGLASVAVSRRHGPAARDMAYDQLAAHASRHLDLDGIGRLLKLQLRGGAS